MASLLGSETSICKHEQSLDYRGAKYLERKWRDVVLDVLCDARQMVQVLRRVEHNVRQNRPQIILELISSL